MKKAVFTLSLIIFAAFTAKAWNPNLEYGTLAEIKLAEKVFVYSALG
jgi:hypothetical protein